jgi:hypothetical protein
MTGEFEALAASEKPDMFALTFLRPGDSRAFQFCETFGLGSTAA